MPTVDVRLVDVVKKFGDTVAVDHINQEVLDGECFSLLGPSGCGKTTPLRMFIWGSARVGVRPAADSKRIEADSTRPILAEAEA